MAFSVVHTASGYMPRRGVATSWLEAKCASFLTGQAGVPSGELEASTGGSGVPEVGVGAPGGGVGPPGKSVGALSEG